MKKVFKVILFLVLAVVILVTAGITYVKTALPNVGAAPVLKVPLTTANIERGRYLVNSVTGCMDCHSPRDFSKLTLPVYSDSIGAGGLKFGHEFGLPGTYYAPNITPYSLSKYTDGELFKVLTTGETRLGKPLFPIMPYLTLGVMDKEDIYAIIAYLRTLKSVTKDNVPEASRDFPVSILVNTMPHPAAFTKRPNPADSIAYGKYLVAFAGCSDCHTPKDDKGQPIPGKDFAGGNPFRLPTGVVRTANITADKETGIGNWTKAQFFAAIRKYQGKPLPTLNKGDFNTIMPYATFSKMTDSDLSSVYAYLHALKPVNNNVVKFEPDSKE